MPSSDSPIRPSSPPTGETPAAPTVSIITPAHNAARFLEGSLRSVAEQSFLDWEMIVVDDGSRDETAAIVERWAARDPRFRLIRLTPNGGAAAARNTALTQVRGRYVAFLDSDDLWRPRKLEVQTAFMRSTGAAFSFGSYSLIDEDGRPIGRCVRAPERIDYQGLLRNTIIGCLTVMLDRSQIQSMSMPLLPQHEDLCLWYSLLKQRDFAWGIAEDLAQYRIVRGSASGNRIRSALHMWTVYRQVERLSLPGSLECFAHYAWNALRKHRY